MLRVWGGGVYGSDEFYDLCDRYGILVWQDFMFACKTYPARDEEFCDNVVNEARDNLRRIRHHASLALLCGNNEIEQAFEDWNVDATKENRTEYLKLFQFLLPGVVAEECPEVFYWPSSPSSGGDFEQPNSTRQGDCHYWAVWFGRKPLSDFREHYFPFMSEYGFESFPSIKTIRTFATPEDLNPSSPVIENHQRCPDGNSRIISYLLIYFRLPHDFESLVYLTQVSHAEAIRWGVEHWRRNRGRCMGSLYWQVNDNWPVVSWSSIDYYGRWKAAHYVARRVYDNVLISCEERGHAASLHLSNERRTPVEGNVSWELRGLDGTVVRRGSARVRVAAHNSKRVAALDFSRELADGADRNTYLSYRFREKRGPTYRGTTTFVPYKHLDLQDPRIAARVTEDGDHLRVTVSASSYAKFVALDLARHDTVFSDNFFDIDAGEHVAVSVPKGALSTAAVRKELRVRSLFDARGGV